jgi:hypothetical protein
VRNGKYASDDCATLSEVFGEEAVKEKLSVLSGINGSNRMWKMKEVFVQNLIEPMEILKKFGI